MSDWPTERQAHLLGLVVRQYIETAQPVASNTLVVRFELSWSAATVRNELAALEEMALLTHPHHSAGRVPTVAGYRFFVEHLMTTSGLTEHAQRTIRHQFHQAGGDPERWLRLSAAVMAQTSGVAALVATPRLQQAPLRRLEMVDLGDGMVQMVAVMADGEVYQARWRPQEPFDQEALDGLSRRVNEGGEARSGLGGDRPPSSPLEAGGLQALEALLAGSGGPAAPRLYHAGLAQILSEPEFAEAAELRVVVELLEHGQGLEDIFQRLPGDGVQVIIGGEGKALGVPHVTMVLARFGEPTRQAGVLGVVGPMRLSYERAVPAVGFVAQLMTQLLAGEGVEAGG